MTYENFSAFRLPALTRLKNEEADIKNIVLYKGDASDILDIIPSESVDAVVTDPPYGIDFMGNYWDDPANIAFSREFWEKVYRVMKPGAHLAAFAATRTSHRTASAIEDAGFDIRDQLIWAFGQGMPKSHNVAKAIVRAGFDDELAQKWEGWGTTLKPAYEPICLARKPLIGTVVKNVLTHATGAINIDACRIEGEPWTPHEATGFGSVKFFSKGEAQTIAKTPHEAGRFPANILHDGSPAALAYFPNIGGGQKRGKGNGKRHGDGMDENEQCCVLSSENSSAARFFYCAKASKSERAGSKHPTVKPVAVMQWLCRLITPPGGVILDPFAGTGTTGEAACAGGFRAMLCERESEYLDDIERRFGADIEVRDW